MVPLPNYLPTPGRYDLFRGVLTPSPVPLPLSAASLQATRLAAAPDHSFVFASKSDVFTVCGSPTRKRARQDDNYDDARSKHMQSSSNGAVSISSAVSSAIADDYIVPRPFSTLQVDRFVAHCAHQSEVQSVVADESRVASVDAYGRCILTVATDDSLADEKMDSTQRESDSFVLPPVSLSSGEPGWAGVSLKARDNSVAVVARQFFRDVTLFDRDVAVRTVYSIMAPMAVGFCGEGNVVAVTEGSGVSFYDLRAGERGGCVVRKSVGNGKLLSLDISTDGGLVATGGMERIVHIFDARTMTVRDRWRGCLKYEIAGIALSREMEGMAYVCSMDNEVACGAWNEEMGAYLRNNIARTDSIMISGANAKSPRRAFGFRGDVRLIGMVRRNVDGEEIAAVSEAGAFYLLRRKRE